MSNFQELAEASANIEVPFNENFESLGFAFVYSKRHEVTDGLDWGYNGGRWGGFSITEGVLTLSDNVTNYIVVARATGVISVSTSIANWNDVSNYARVYKVIVSGGAPVTEEDHRAGTRGLFPADTTIGRHEIPIMAAAMQPSVTNGCDGFAVAELTAGQPNIGYLAFPAGSNTRAQFAVPMPKSWDQGSVTFKPIWTHPTGGSAFGVIWALKGIARSNDDAIDVAFGTAQNSSDTGGTANDLYTGPESSAITVISGSPALVDIVFFEIARLGGSDTLDVEARLLGIQLIITTDAENDA